MSQIIHAQNGLFFVEVDLPKMGFQVRGAAMVGQKRVIIWDTLTHPRDMQPLVGIYAGKPLTVIYSHADWDHVWGTASVPCNEIIAHSTCPERFSRDLPDTLKKMRVDYPGEWEGIKLMPPTLTFNTNINIDIGGMSLEIHALPGHTKDSIVGFIPESGVLLAGDAVEDPFPLINDPSSINNWISKLKLWANDPRLEMVVPAHGAISDVNLIKRNIAYLENLLSGQSISEDLTGFYEQAHQENIKKITGSKKQ